MDVKDQFSHHNVDFCNKASCGDHSFFSNVSNYGARLTRWGKNVLRSKLAGFSGSFNIDLVGEKDVPLSDKELGCTKSLVKPTSHPQTIRERSSFPLRRPCR